MQHALRAPYRPADQAGTLRLFALAGSDGLGRSVAERLDIDLAAHEEREFEDGEHKARPLACVAGADVYVLHSLHGGPQASANDKLCRLLFFLAAIRHLPNQAADPVWAPWEQGLHRDGGREGPGAVQDFRPGAIEPDHIVPAGRDRQAIGDLAVAAAELNVNAAVGTLLCSDVVE